MSTPTAPTADTPTIAYSGESGLDLEPDPDAHAPGRVLGRYLVIDTIGRGGMGLVVRAYDPKLQREVALKLVRAGTITADAQARLIREARAMAKLSHPNVVAVYDVELDSEEGVLLAMEYVPGTTLRRWLLEASRSWRDVVDVFCDAGRRLQAAHAAGLLHRDFKPDNVLVETGARPGHGSRVRVTDFGLARPSTEHSSEQPSTEALDDVGVSVEGVVAELTRAGVVMGTPSYMAPEQHEGHELGPAADQYAYCVSLWWALSGVFPFDGRGVKLLMAKRAGPPTRPPPGTVPRRVFDVIRRGLEPNAARRWPSMEELITKLVDCAAPRRRGRAAIVTGSLAIGGIAVVSSAWVVQRDDVCTGGVDAIEEAWSEDRRDAVRAAMDATGVAYARAMWERIEPRLDAYATSWVEMHTDACEATTVRGEQSAAAMDLRMACLARARVDLRATTELLAQIDASGLERAHAMVDALPMLSRCTEVAALESTAAPPAPEEAEEVEAVRELLTRARTRRIAGRMIEAEAAVEEAVARMERLNHAPLRVEAMLELGLIRESTAEYGAAEQALKTVLREGLRRRQWDAAAEAAVRLVTIVGHRPNRHAEGLAYLEAAWGLVDHLGIPALAESRIRSQHASILEAQGRLEEAEAEYRIALELRVDGVGPVHAEVARVRTSLGSAYYHLRRYDDAERELLSALEIWEQLVGPRHPSNTFVLNNLAGVYQQQGNVARAEETLLAAIAIHAEAFGEGSLHATTLRSNLGELYRANARLADAEREFTRALAIHEAAHDLDHPGAIRALLNRADTRLDLSRPSEALADADQALAITTRVAMPPLIVAGAKFAVARALRANDRDQARARALAEEAREAFAAAGEEHRDALVAIESFLRSAGR